VRVEDDRREDDVRRTRSGAKRSAAPERRKADHQPQPEPESTDTSKAPKIHIDRKPIGAPT